VIDATRAAMMLALPLTDEKLDSLERGAGDGEIAGRGRTGGGLLARPSTGCAPVSLPKYSPPMPRPPRGGRGSWQAVRSAAHGPIPLMGIPHQESAVGVNPRFGRHTATCYIRRELSASPTIREIKNWFGLSASF
jgi:hypothetical protein